MASCIDTRLAVCIDTFYTFRVDEYFLNIYIKYRRWQLYTAVCSNRRVDVLFYGSKQANHYPSLWVYVSSLVLGHFRLWWLWSWDRCVHALWLLFISVLGYFRPKDWTDLSTSVLRKPMLSRCHHSLWYSKVSLHYVRHCHIKFMTDLATPSRVYSVHIAGLAS